MLRRARKISLVSAAGASLLLMPGLVQASSRKSPHVCSGSSSHPGVLKGHYASGVLVKGFCAVNSGKADVIGTLTVSKGATLAAAYGKHGSALKVTGNLVVDSDGVAVLGCKVNQGETGYACLDQPNSSAPTLTGHEDVTGNLIGHSALAVVVHNSAIGGNVTQTGGGGGLNCGLPKTGPFAAFNSPVYSDYEDSTIGGSAVIKNLKSCWLGFGREYVGKSVTINDNEMDDPDAIEVFSNYITKNLGCKSNSHPPKGMPPHDEPVWDTTDIKDTSLYPRREEPNTVEGTRSGQCRHATPATPGGPSQGPF